MSYAPLFDSTSIRILNLVDGNDDIITCSIEVVSLKKSPHFRSLSYTWGPPQKLPGKELVIEEERTILCDGNRLSIKSNLYDALLQIWKTSREGPLWIDAICINQGDLHERNHQVGMMDQIYASASQVIVWLGKDDADAHCAERFFTSYGMFMVEVQKHWDEEGPVPLTKNAIELIDKSIGWEPKSSQEWKSLAAFFNHRTWFERAWVMQEIALARDIVVLCGSLHLSWEQVSAVARLLRGSDMGMKLAKRTTQTPEYIDIGQRCTTLGEVRRYVSGHYTQPDLARTLDGSFGAHTNAEQLYGFIELMLESVVNFKTTEPRDKCYAVLGLIARFPGYQKNILLQPDYSKSVVSVYTDVATEILRGKTCPSLLSLVLQSPFRRMPSLPSWVPDFSQPHVSSVLFLGSLFGNNRFNANKGIIPKNPLLPLSIEANTLSISGAEWDTVIEVGPVK